MGQNLIKLQENIHKSAPILRDLNIYILVINRSSRQVIIKYIVEMNSTINQLDLIDMHRIRHQTIAEYTFFSDSHGTCTRYTIFQAIIHIFMEKKNRNHTKYALRSQWT